MVKFFHTLIYLRLPSNVEYFTVTQLNQAHVFNKAQRINTVNCFFHKIQKIFHSITLFIGEYYQIMWVLVFTIISEQRRLSWIMLGKNNISVWLIQHFAFLLLRTREGYMSTIKKSRLISAGEIPFKLAWVRLPLIGIDRDSAIIDLAYLFAGLVTITQSRLVHRILQGVEHTDPTEWSNLHRSIGEKFCNGCSTNSQSFQGLFTIFFSTTI